MKCLIEGCEKESACRGLCWNHYQITRRWAGSNKAKWDELVAAGFALIPSPPGRKKSELSLRLANLPGQQLIPEIITGAS